MRLGFIGSHGHHKLRRLLIDAEAAVDAVAVAPDGHGSPALNGLAERYPRLKTFDDARRMLDAFKPDILSVGAIFAHNGEHVAAALQRDIPVCSDKPIAATWERFEQLVRLSRENPRRVVVTEFDARSRPAFRAARLAVEQGYLGQIVLATAQKSYRFGATRPDWYARRADYAGTVLWVAAHAIDFTRFVTGLQYASVFGQAANLNRAQYGTLEEMTLNVFTLGNGGSAVVHADYCRPAAAATHGDDRLRVVGSLGQIEVVNDRCLLTTHEAAERDVTDWATPEPMERELLAALRGERSDLYGTPTSLEIARVLLHARDAADRGERIAIL